MSFRDRPPVLIHELLGLTFKAGTDDLPDSPALAVAGLLVAAGAKVTGYDPTTVGSGQIGGITVVDDPYEVADGSTALVLLTDSPELVSLDWHRVASILDGTVVIDARNQLDAEPLRRAGLDWYGTGNRPVRSAG